MPATAGRVKMPAGNRMQTSASLNTHSIWQNAIGYDPYAAESTGADTGANAEAAADARDSLVPAPAAHSILAALKVGVRCIR